MNEPVIENAGGLLPHVEDERDFRYEHLGGIFGGYTPKHDVWVLPMISVKNQGEFNDCVYNSLAAQREVDEGVPLSVKSVVCYARKKGYISGNGFSDLRSGQKASIEFGLSEEAVLPDIKTAWDNYSDFSNITDAVQKNADFHKSKSYFLVSSKDEWLKALDDKHAIHCGIQWFTSYNMVGGLTAPWILPWETGSLVAGHAITCIGYDIPRQLLKFQNSFGKEWAENGCFYVKMSDWFRFRQVGYVSVDVNPTDLAQFVTQYEGKQVKSANSPVIYLIKNGQKCPFPDEVTFYAFGGVLGEGQTWVLVSQGLLDQIPQGDTMSITSSKYWPVLKDNWNVIKWLQSPSNFQAIDEKIKMYGESNPVEENDA